MTQCPCGTGNTYELCCGVYIIGSATPNTPEALMRSRYTAYTLAEVDYILRTMKAPASNGFDLEGARAWAKNVTWIKLEVINASQATDRGSVEFVATFKDGKENLSLHEISEFHCIDGVWFYVDGVMPTCCDGDNHDHH